MRPHRSGGFGSDGRFRTKRQYIAADGLPAVKEFRARKGETQRSVLLRADTWVAEQKGKVPCPSIKIEAALDVFIEHRQEQGKADKTIKVYKFAAKIIGKHLGGLRIDQVGIYAVEKMLKKWQDKPRTAKMLREFGRNAYNWFERNGWVERNPFRDAEPVTYAAEQWEEPISASHFDKALEHAQAEAVPILLLLRWTGIRPIAARSLLWADVSERDDGMWLKKRAKTDASARPIPVPDVVAEHLRQLPRTSLFVFLTSRGKPYSEHALSVAWRKAQESAKLTPVNLYALRHLRATELHRITDDVTLARMMGHTDARTTKTFYVQVENERLRKASEGK